MTFDDIRGQGPAVRTLREALRSGRVAHAYLFAGPAGVGKQTTARVFAHALQRAKSASDPRASCSTDTGPAGASAGVLSVLPAGKAERIGIDEIRQMQHTVSLRPLEGERTVCLIDGAEAMTEPAANALLKVLEEPPPHAVIILISAAVRKMPQTIVSRCCVILFSAVPAAAIEERLVAGGAAVASAHVLARAAQGSMGAALAMQAADFLSVRDEILRMLKDIPVFPLENWCRPADEDVIRSRVAVAVTLFRDAMLLQHDAAHRTLVHSDRVRQLEGLAHAYSRRRCLEIIEQLQQAIDHCDRNVPPDLIAAAAW